MTWLVGGVCVMSLVLHLGASMLLLEPLTAELASSLAGRISMTRTLLQHTAAPERARTARDIGDTEFDVRQVTEVEPALAGRPPPRAPGQSLERLQQAVGSDGIVSVAALDGGDRPSPLLFEFTVEDQRWQARYQIGHPPAMAALGTGLGWFGLLGLAVFLSLTIGVRSMARPLSNLTRQLKAQGDLLRPVPVPTHAAPEIETLVHAFNQLAGAVLIADRTKQHLLAGVSHDLRTPLARLRLRIETQCEGVLAVALASDLQAVERIVSQFLAYVQGDTQAAQGEPESVRAMLEQVVSDYTAQGADVRLQTTQVEVDLPDLSLQRTLHNLVDNALSHGKPPVWMSLTDKVSPAGRAMTLTVWDHGAGISAEEFDQALLPFVRLSSSKSDLGHCGLGLAIVAQFAHQLGGSLERAASNDGRFGIALTWQTTKPTRP
jgi:two-component system osmolarity sensor histidine kinase EnvZ